MARIFFITGTDTGVGKTVVSVLLTRHLAAAGVRVCAVKPFCSGGRDDAEALYEAQGGAVPLDEINPWHFAAPLTPLLAARRERRRVDLKMALAFLRSSSKRADVLVIEGAGGLLSPLGEWFSALDLITRLRATPVVVCPDRLGAINQARLAFAALPPRFRELGELILVRPAKPDTSVRTNREMLEELLGAERVHSLGWLKHDPLACHVPGGMRALARRLASLQTGL